MHSFRGEFHQKHASSTKEGNGIMYTMTATFREIAMILS